ncbi:MAG: ATP-dependent Clp protease proteolytic subunit [Firmicutes bacterium]|nr:ATP-dependent Clp protease proteolytic subunit [Bacillota bacterium]
MDGGARPSRPAARRPRRGRRLAALLLGVLLASAVAPAGSRAADSRPLVEVLAFRGAVEPVSAALVTARIRQAERDGAAAFVLELDTPGGGMESMRQIAQAMLASSVPVVVYVYPSGARAASAGTFLAYAAHIAAMAPGTEIGAASPVGAGGSQLSPTEAAKVTSDAVAMITAWAERNGRNAAWAAEAVRSAASLPAQEALRQHVVDAVAPSLEKLLRQLDGREVVVASAEGERRVRLDLAGASVRLIPVPWWTQAAEVLADPNLSLLLLSLGFWGLVSEFAHPNLAGGVLGGIAAILGLLGLELLSASAVGVLLVLAGLALFLVGLKVQAHGFVSAAGALAFALGSLFLFPSTGVPGLPAPSPAPLLVGGLVLLSLAASLGVGWLVRRSRRPALALGAGGLVGLRGRVLEPVRAPGERPAGLVRAGGSDWRAVLAPPPAGQEAAPGALPPGSEVEVVAVRGLTLVVRPAGPQRADGE